MVQDASKIAIWVVYFPDTVIVDTSSGVGEGVDHSRHYYVEDEAL